MKGKLISLVLWSQSAWADAPVQPESPVAVAFLADRGPAIRIRAVSGAVAIPSCRGISWERFSSRSNAYELLQESPCGAMAPAIWVDEQGLDMAAPTGLGLAPGDQVRVSLVVGIGCTEGVSLEVAGCTEILWLKGAVLGTVR